LGYDKAKWDSDAETAATNKSWNELTEAEQKAAGVMGYDKAQWDCS